MLTKKQIEILKLRSKGHSQSDIAKKLGTSRANVSAIEKSAWENVKRAEDTLKIIDSIKASFHITIPKDTDLYDAVGMIYKESNEKNIRIPCNGPVLTGIIADKAGDRIHGRRIVNELEIYVTEKGEIII